MYTTIVSNKQILKKKKAIVSNKQILKKKKTMPSGTSKSKKKQRGGNDDARNKATHQNTIRNAFKTKPKHERFIGADILLMDEIYGKRGAPKNTKGKNFRYIVTEYVEENETFALKYKKQAINPAKTPMFFMHSKKRRIWRL